MARKKNYPPGDYRQGLLDSLEELASRIRRGDLAPEQEGQLFWSILAEVQQLNRDASRTTRKTAPR